MKTDLNSLMSTLLNDDSINSVSGKSGMSAGDTAGVLAAALPALLSGANGQAQNPDTTDGFHEALNSHAAKDPQNVDLAEGEKILEHLLGGDQAKTEKAIARKTGMSKAQVAMILAAAAPLIMNLLGKNNQSHNANSSGSTASLMGSLLGGGSGSDSVSPLVTAALGAVLSSALSGNNSHSSGSNSILESLLGSQQQAAQSSGGAGFLGSLMNSALDSDSGNSNNSSGFGLGDILSSLLK